MSFYLDYHKITSAVHLHWNAIHNSIKVDLYWFFFSPGSTETHEEYSFSLCFSAGSCVHSPYLSLLLSSLPHLEMCAVFLYCRYYGLHNYFTQMTSEKIILKILVALNYLESFPQNHIKASIVYKFNQNLCTH